MQRNQFKLLTQRRFLPLFLTQFLGAFNDNVFKNSLIILISFQLVNQAMSSDTLINLAAACFILPYFLFSATFGQLTDRYEKSRIVRITKWLELVIVILASIAFFTNNVWLLLSVLFLLGTQSTLFGPAKYSILPQQLSEAELVGGNALFESSTFIAILIGTLAGGILITLEPDGRMWVSIAIVIVALCGLIASYFVPQSPSAGEKVKIDWNIARAGMELIQLARQRRTVFLSLLGVSWFWFYGSLFFYQVANYVKDVLGGGPHLVTLLITIFAIGIGIGSLLCEKLSRRNIELALVPFGAIGLTVFGLAMYFIEPRATHIHQTVLSFIAQPRNIFLLLTLFFMAVFGGLYNVPLYALIQDRTPMEYRSRIIAANNILNALFMVLAAVFAIVLLKFGLTIPHLFLVTAILNAGISIYIFSELPEFIMRFLICSVGVMCYRIKTKGTENLPTRPQPVICVSNHVSFVDAVILSAVSILPLRFMMDFRLFKSPGLSIISKLAKVIPVTTGAENEKLKNRALYRAVEALNNREVVFIFPEGTITRDGKIGPLKRGIEKLVKQTHAPVIPMAVQGLWGSFFSRKYGAAMAHFPKRWKKTTVGLNIGKPIPYEEFSLERLRRDMVALYEDRLDPDIPYEHD